jgi:hypothetical protein
MIGFSPSIHDFKRPLGGKVAGGRPKGGHDTGGSAPAVQFFSAVSLMLIRMGLGPAIYDFAAPWAEFRLSNTAQ